MRGEWVQVETRSLSTEPLASQHLEAGGESEHSSPGSSGFSPDALLFLIGQVEFEWEFLKWRVHAGCRNSAENLSRRYIWLEWRPQSESTAGRSPGIPGWEAIGRLIVETEEQERE